VFAYISVPLRKASSRDAKSSKSTRTAQRAPCLAIPQTWQFESIKQKYAGGTKDLCCVRPTRSKKLHNRPQVCDK